MNELLFIRVDAGAHGWGHLMRCLAVAVAWRKRGHQVVFLLRSGEYDVEISRRLRHLQFDFRFFVADSIASEIRVINTEIAQESPFIVLIDGYAFGDEYQQNLRLGHARLAAFDDFGHANHTAAEFVINGNAYANPRPTRQNQRWLCGARFLPLRAEIVAAVSRAVVDLKASSNLLVMLGACPSNELVFSTTHTILRLIADRPEQFRRVDIVVGQRKLEQIPHFNQLNLENTCSLKFHTNPGTLVELMENADLAISAAGSTLYELASIGVPTVAFAVAENQYSVLRSLVEREVVWDCRTPTTDNGVSLRMAVEAAVSAGDAELASRRRRGMSLVDGRGADRIAASLDLEPIRLRHAAYEDLIPLFELRNETEVRNNSINQSLVTYEEHERWLTAKLRDDRCCLLVVVSRSNQVVGQVRFDLTPDSGGVFISVSLAPEIRGLGLAGAILDDAILQTSGELDFDFVIAQVRESNLASRKAFENCGFLDFGSEWIQGTQYRKLCLRNRLAALQ